MSKSEIQKMIKRIERHMVAVGKERDKIDNTLMDLEGLKENCESAHDSLHAARDALSELV